MNKSQTITEIVIAILGRWSEMVSIRVCVFIRSDADLLLTFGFLLGLQSELYTSQRIKLNLTGEHSC